MSMKEEEVHIYYQPPNPSPVLATTDEKEHTVVINPYSYHDAKRPLAGKGFIGLLACVGFIALALLVKRK